VCLCVCCWFLFVVLKYFTSTYSFVPGFWEAGFLSIEFEADGAAYITMDSMEGIKWVIMMAAVQLEDLNTFLCGFLDVDGMLLLE